MSIIRGHSSPDDHYTIMSNVWLRDERLSLRARGLYGQILSHRTGWKITVETLVRVNPEGRDAIRSAIRELREHGYLIVRPRQDEHGRLAGQDYVTADPFAPVTALLETRSTGEPSSGESDTKKNKIKKTNLKNNQLPTSSSSVTEVDASAGDDDEEGSPQVPSHLVDTEAVRRHLVVVTGRDARIEHAIEVSAAVLERAKNYPAKPTAYVKSAITRNEFGWGKYIDTGKVPA